MRDAERPGSGIRRRTTPGTGFRVRSPAARSAGRGGPASVMITAAGRHPAGERPGRSVCQVQDPQAPEFVQARIRHTAALGSVEDACPELTYMELMEPS